MPKKSKSAKPFVVTPSRLANCRNLCNTDLPAAVLLYRLIGLWIFRKDKLKRCGKEWIAMSREEWARSAGLTISELKDRALPRMKAACAEFVEVRTMRLTFTEPNKVWMSLDLEELHKHLTPQDMYEDELNGFGIFPPEKKYPYKKGPQ